MQSNYSCFSGNNSDRLTVKMGLKLSQLIEVVSSVDFQKKKDNKENLSHL